MNIKRIIAAGAVAAVASVGFAASASAGEYVSDYAVPGHAKQERQGKVVTHGIQITEAAGVTCEVIVNTVGDFGGDPYMNDGKMMNREKCDDGSVYTYHIFHASHPGANPETMTPIWGDWYYFGTANKAGR